MHPKGLNFNSSEMAVPNDKRMKIHSQLLLKAGCRLLEPNMAIQIIAPADRTAQVLADLSRRRAEILDVTTRGANKVIETLIAF